MNSILYRYSFNKKQKECEISNEKVLNGIFYVCTFMEEMSVQLELHRHKIYSLCSKYIYYNWHNCSTKIVISRNAMHIVKNMTLRILISL